MIRDGWAPDRRRAERQVVSSSLQVLVEGDGTPVRVHELGAGGMVLEMTRPLIANQLLEFWLGLERDTPRSMRGRVAHSRLLLPTRLGEQPSYLAGITFEQVTTEQTTHIARLLATIDERRTSRAQDPS